MNCIGILTTHITTYLISLSISNQLLTISYKLYGGGVKVSCPKSEKYAACFMRRQKRKDNTVLELHTSETIITILGLNY